MLPPLHKRPVIVLGFFIFAVAAPCIRANVYTPTTFTDPAYTAINNATGVITAGAGVGLISLRSALVAADALGGTHTVTLSTGTYNLSRAPKSQIVIGNTPQNITINGNGPANTIINMVNDANKDRILFINPVGTTNSPVITVNGITFQNGYLTSDFFGGAAICSGGGSAESLTVNNSAFLNNTLPANAYGGAAVNVQVRGNLTVDNSTFTNNVSNDADGGAILFIIFGSALGTHYGTVSITNSVFTNNSVIFPGVGSSNGGAVTVSSQGGASTFNATINNNTFISNATDGYGGGLVINNGPNLSISQIHFNRFFNNTASAIGPPVGALSSGLHFAESSGSANAENNWWGCSTNPVNVLSTAPCNQAGGDVPGLGSLDANPWLQLRTAASPSSIVTNQTSALTTSFLANSDGTAVTLANISTLLGRTVTWSSLGGSLSGQQGTIQAAGTATATYSETTGVAGTHSVTAVVDSGPMTGSTNTAAITVGKANTTTAITTNLTTPTVTGQPYTVAFSITAAFGLSPTAATGNVQVSDGSQTCLGAINAAGTGSCILTSTTAGNKTITATYQGNANFNASPVSPGTAHLVNKADTTVAVVSNANPSVFGQSVTFTATITVTAPGAGSPTGNITFKDNGVNIGTCTAQTVASSVATCAISTLSVATHPITATYNSDANFNASPASPILSQVVNKASTTVALGTSGTPTIFGQSVTFTATISVTAPGAGAPTGNITFKDNSVNIGTCTAQTVAANVATCGISTLSVATHPITAVYNGDTNFNLSPASSIVNQVVNKASTTTGITSSQNPSLTGQSVTFTATVAVTAPGAGTPTGTVNFLDGGVSITGCSAVGLTGSTAQCMTSALTAASHTITAIYGGDGSFNASPAGSMTGNPQVVSNTAVWDGSASGDWNTPANWATNFVPLAVHDVSLPSAGVANQAMLPSGNPTVNSLTIAAGRTLGLAGGNLTLNGLLTMGGGNITVNPGSLLVFGTTSTVTRTSGHIIGDARKMFGGVGSFTFPLGTGATSFSPLNVTVTAGSGQLTARATTGMPGTVSLDPLRTLQRYWTLSGSGITSNITFNYLDGDIPATPGTENLWNIIRVTGPVAVRFPPTLPYVTMDPANNRFTMNNLTSYSDWTAGEPLAPTAANVNVSGRVVDADGRGILGAQVSMQNQEGTVIWANTNPFGYYRFSGVPAGQIYFVTPRHKRFEFQSRTINLSDELIGLDFVAEP